MENTNNQLVDNNIETTNNLLINTNINQEQLNWICEKIQHLNDKNDDLRNMFMDHILKLTNNYINIIENNNCDKVKNEIIGESENDKRIKDLIILISKFENENTTLHIENKTLKNNLYKYTHEYVRNIPKELIRLVHKNNKIEPRPCIKIINNNKCDNKNCFFWHNYSEAKSWNIEIDNIKKQIKDNNIKRDRDRDRNRNRNRDRDQELKRTRENEYTDNKKPRFFKY